MGVDGDDLVASAHPADDVAELIELDLVIAQLFHLGSDALDDALFLAGLGRDRDHVAEELCHVGTVAFGSLLDSIIIHKRRVPPIYLFIILSDLRRLPCRRLLLPSYHMKSRCQTKFLLT